MKSRQVRKLLSGGQGKMTTMMGAVDSNPPPQRFSGAVESTSRRPSTLVVGEGRTKREREKQNFVRSTHRPHTEGRTSKRASTFLQVAAYGSGCAPWFGQSTTIWQDRKIFSSLTFLQSSQ